MVGHSLLAGIPSTKPPSTYPPIAHTFTAMDIAAVWYPLDGLSVSHSSLPVDVLLVELVAITNPLIHIPAIFSSSAELRDV